MAALIPARPRPLTQVEIIGKLYLKLWKRLDLIDGENKWADVAPIESAVNAALHEEAEALYRQAVAVIGHGRMVPQFGALKIQLRDEAFRFMDQAARTR